MDVSKAVKARAAEAKWSQDDLFTEVDADKDGIISKAELAAFLKSCKDYNFVDENFDKVFESLDREEGKDSINKESFLRFVRVYYRVVKETVLTTQRAIKESKTIRRLAVDELISILEGPIRDDSLDVVRIRGSCRDRPIPERGRSFRCARIRPEGRRGEMCAHEGEGQGGWRSGMG